MVLENFISSIVYWFTFIFDVKFVNLFVITIALVLSMLFIWAMYMHLSKKDLFEIPHPKKEDSKIKQFLMKSAFFLKYIIIFPGYSFIWFIAFTTILILMSKPENPDSILFFSIILIAAIRVSSYINERLSEDIAKLFPLTFISTIVASPEFLTFNLESIMEFFSISTLLNSLMRVPSYIKYLLFIIILEWILRLGNVTVDVITEMKEDAKTRSEIKSDKNKKLNSFFNFNKKDLNKKDDK